jgi:hypothetical protein
MGQNLDALFGPGGHGEYAAGQVITFTENDKELQGTIIHVAAPGQTVTGKATPVEYQVDAGDGFPHVVYQNQIIEMKEQRCPYCAEPGVKAPELELDDDQFSTYQCKNKHTFFVQDTQG